MRQILLVISVLLAGLPAFSQKLSDQSSVSIITCGPDPGVVYLAFGHSAIRIQDPAGGFDYVFNYGVFDFNQPNFYLNFARGSNNYMLGAYDYQYFKRSYIEDNRFLHEQVLNLTLSQKQRLYEFLVWNALPQNRAYWYDPYYDNCATRIRDAFVKVLGDSVKFDGSYIKTENSIRQLTDIYLINYPWGDLGIDIGQGMPIDVKATPYQHMFLPAYVESGFDHATIRNDTATIPLVAQKTIVYEAVPQPKTGLPHPLYVFAFVAFIALVLCGRDFRKQELSMWFDALLFSVTGFLGIVLVLLWFVTDHKASANNLNIAWALPTNLIAAIAFIRNRPWLKWYFLVVALIQLSLLGGWFFLPQQMNTALIPIVVALMMRAYIQYILRKRGAFTRAKILKDEVL